MLKKHKHVRHKIDHKYYFLNIPIKPIDTYQITMNQNMAQTLLLLYSLLPIFIALWGGLILYLRKR